MQMRPNSISQGFFISFFHLAYMMTETAFLSDTTWQKQAETRNMTSIKDLLDCQSTQQPLFTTFTK